ncbi:hypothetical protein SD10_10710 [Spirosoma radiotolerans]|uniref:Uncharacterized protein n=1 Tax=Spirosoma radiotolerans TaxID=1379870 RepID=A0A0E3V6T5_9BACT|nr:hypothetical protein SD10_10710 [Spirosoma radiotolerans]
MYLFFLFTNFVSLVTEVTDEIAFFQFRLYSKTSKKRPFPANWGRFFFLFKISSVDYRPISK